MSRQNNSKATKFAHVVDGCSGDENIADRWKVHFSQLFNANVDDTAKTKFHSSISSVLESSCFSDITVTIDDVEDACAKQKCGKAAGPDGIDMEAVLFGGHRLRVHLCLLFNLFIKYSYLPNSFMESVMVPLVKNKCGK